jgi:hypothetical protein
MATKLTSAGRVSLTAEELADYNASLSEWTAGANDRVASALRTERNAKLAKSDWTQVADAPVDQTAWAVYRQALRDIPDQEGFPNKIEWPIEP